MRVAGPLSRKRPEPWELDCVFMHTVTQTTFRSDALAKALPLSLVVPDGDAPVGGWPLFFLLLGRVGDHR